MLKAIKSVLVIFTEEGRDESSAALAYALSLSQQAKAHLTIQAASMRYAVPSSIVSQFGAQLIGRENRRIASLAEAFANNAKGSADLAGVACTVETPQLVYTSLCERFLAYARVHDVSILDMEKVALDRDRGLIDAALFESGRPALIVPETINQFSARRILIAWDGGASAARAVADAMSFLSSADEVEILSVTGEKDLADRIAGAELAPHLARHGANVTVKNVAMTKQNDVAGMIRDEAASFGAELIVSGAYKHSRLREWILGGVTQSLLKNCPLPILMSH